MGREVKRVPVDFDWPARKVWLGYQQPDESDPPEGEGWQLWETVSEGSPVSPVFPTAEELATWMTENNCTVTGPMRSFDAALRFVHAGWAPSMAETPETGVVSGAEWVGGRDTAK